MRSHPEAAQGRDSWKAFTSHDLMRLGTMNRRAAILAALDVG